MDFNALKTIKNYNLKLSLLDCKNKAESFLKLISKKYPKGKSEYFVMVGFEHVTKNQPIAQYNTDLNEWEIKSITKF